MKKALFLMFSSLGLIFAISILGSSLLNTIVEDNVIDKNSPDVLGEESNDNENLILSYNNNSYRLQWFKADLSNLLLIPNFEARDNANEIVSKNSCKNAINAGFYDTDNTPLGLFISDEKILYNFRSNKIMNAILSINRFDTPRITREVPSDPLVSAVQTGPILIENDKPLDVQINTDKSARRSIAFVTGDNELYFMSIFTTNSGFSGPNLHELPEILSEFEKQTGINIADAVNLDGGSASYYKSEKTTITELSPIGALFCVK